MDPFTEQGVAGGMEHWSRTREVRGMDQGWRFDQGPGLEVWTRDQGPEKWEDWVDYIHANQTPMDSLVPKQCKKDRQTHRLLMLQL